MNERIVIVGSGEIGRRFATAAESLGASVTRVSRADSAGAIQGERGTPVIVCVRETDLAGVLERVSPERAADLVVVQNGFVDELLVPYAGHTRAVLWFTSKGSFFADLLPSPVCGPRAEQVRDLIRAVGATAETIADRAVFGRRVVEKAVWCCVVGAPLKLWDCDFATGLQDHIGEVEAIVSEACEAAARALGAEISSQRVLATLIDTSLQVGWMQGSTNAIAWRNGKVVEWGVRYGVETPANRAIVEGAR